jgi:hypothetical protein
LQNLKLFNVQELLYCILVIPVIFSCKKTKAPENIERTYNCNSNNILYVPMINPLIQQLTDTNFTGSVCGVIPLHRTNYWIYRDSVFNSSGVFTQVKLDTITISAIKKSTVDTSMWWFLKSNSLKGLMHVLYTTDSITYFANNSWGSYYVEKWFVVPRKDSSRFAFAFTDVIASDSTFKINNISVPAGNFINCYRSYKKYLQSGTFETFYKPGIGVVRFNLYNNGPIAGQPGFTKLQKSELVSYHIVQ